MASSTVQLVDFVDAQSRTTGYASSDGLQGLNQIALLSFWVTQLLCNAVSSNICQGINGDTASIHAAGYPVAPEEKAQAAGCPLPAVHKDWIEYVSRFQTCPVTNSVQSPAY